MGEFFGLPGNVWSGVIASVVVLAFYWLAAYSRESVQEGTWRGNPLVITVGVHGRASLSNLQVFFFSLIVFWILTYHVAKELTLSDLSPHVLYLLGIGAAGTVGAKVTALSRQRLSLVNWAWLKRKGWIKKSIDPPARPPRWTDLITSEDTFDVYKFQTLVVSLIVGISLLASGLAAGSTGGLESFIIPNSLLGLLGLSQAVNVTGKATGSPVRINLGAQLDKVRKLEGEFVAATAKAWKKSKRDVADIDAAIKAAPEEYNAFLAAAKEAAEMVQERIQAKQPPKIVADFPSI